MNNFLKSVCAVAMVALFAGCTQESQNKLGRAVQNWTGTNGVLEIYAGEKLVKRFMKIDKLSTAIGTSDSVPRPYRFGYGVLDENLNGEIDANEDEVYFEVSDYSTFYIFYDQPKKKQAATTACKISYFGADASSTINHFPSRFLALTTFPTVS